MRILSGNKSVVQTCEGDDGWRGIQVASKKSSKGLRIRILGEENPGLYHQLTEATRAMSTSKSEE